MKPTMNHTEQVFVYGTLRPPRPGTPADDSRYYPKIALYIQKAIPAQLKRADLFDLGTYPGARPGATVVEGDLLTVESDAMPIMDRIEGHPTFFKRDKVVVTFEHGSVEAWVYWAPEDFAFGRRRITNGDWLQRHLAGADVDFEPPDQSKVDQTLRKLVQRFAQAECSWLSSVRPNGRAHSAPIWHVWYQGRVYMVTLAAAVRTVNILENPSVVITHPDPVDPVIIEGWATPAAAMEGQLQPLFNTKYNWDISSDAEYDTILEITPTKLLAWGKYGEGRWRGADLLRVWDV